MANILLCSGWYVVLRMLVLLSQTLMHNYIHARTEIESRVKFASLVPHPQQLCEIPGMVWHFLKSSIFSCGKNDSEFCCDP